jgi:predicted O-methyltransferase YrrM
LSFVAQGQTIKGYSADILLELIGLNMQYDFIYIDGSHMCLDVFLDLFLSWKLLRKGGVMAIDDYLFHVNKVKEYPYNYPYEAVNTFLKQREGEYILIDMDYRVFLEKITPLKI